MIGKKYPKATPLQRGWGIVDLGVLIDQVSVGIVAVNDAGQIEFFNRAAERMFEYVSGEVIGRPMTSLVGAVCRLRDGACHGRNDTAACLTQAPNHLEAEGVTKSGAKFPLLLDIADVCVHRHHFFICTVIPCGSEPGFIASPPEARDSIERGTANYLHDINNLLNVINGSLEIARPMMGGERKAIQLVDRAAKAAASGVELARSYFQRDRMAGKLEIVNLNDAAATVAELLGHDLDRNIVVDLQLAPDLHVSRLARAELVSAVLNLALNACHAMENRGGHLIIETANARQPSTEPDGVARDGVSISVADTGLGMSEQQIKCVTTPFYSTKTSRGGQGLGLANVRRFVKTMNGFFDISSRPDRGTRVELWFPVAEA